MMQITELEVWKAGIELAKSTYEITEKFPSSENHGLAYQLRRTVTGVPSNVAAAASRKHGKESLRHLFKARDLIYEVESLYYLSERLGFITESELETMLETLNTSKRLLFGFIKYYKRSGPYENHGGPRRRSDYHHDSGDHDHSDHNDQDDVIQDDEF
jgi:four helix bundle protein